MNTYVIRILSFHPQSINIVQSLLGSTTVKALVFPAMMATHSNSQVKLNSDKEFDVVQIPQEFYTKSLVNFSLQSESGIEFSSTIYLKETVAPNVINLKFYEKHLQDGSVNLANLKALLYELIPVFKADYASVYEERSSYHPRVSKYLKAANFRAYPLDLGWITYFGSPVINILGRERFEMLQTYTEKYDLHDGIMVILHEEPFCGDNITYQIQQSQAEAELQLLELASK